MNCGRQRRGRFLNHNRGTRPKSLSTCHATLFWFVRLRAIVSLGELGDLRAIPPLMRGVTDSNRLVRLRAAEALLGAQARYGSDL